MNAYEYRHVVSFEETNLIGNVYYANHVRWQGRVREMFLRDHAPEILKDLDRGLRLVTTRVSCEYFTELFAFDEVLIRMYAGAVAQNRVTMRYEYLRIGPAEPEIVARGEQQIACMHQEGDRMVPVPIPRALREALSHYGYS